MRLLTRLNSELARVEGVVLSVLLLVMIVLAFAQVVARNVFNAGFPWADTIVRYMVIWVGFLGAALATQLGQHLSIDALTKFLSERVRRVTGIVVKIFACAVCFYLLSASLRFLEIERSTGQEFLELFPLWWSQTIIPATFVLIPFHYTVSILEDILSIRTRGPKPA